MSHGEEPASRRRNRIPFLRSRQPAAVYQKPIYQLRCPKCGQRVELDTWDGKVVELVRRADGNRYLHPCKP